MSIVLLFGVCIAFTEWSVLLVTSIFHPYGHFITYCIALNVYAYRTFTYKNKLALHLKQHSFKMLQRKSNQCLVCLNHLNAHNSCCWDFLISVWSWDLHCVLQRNPTRRLTWSWRTRRRGAFSSHGSLEMNTTVPHRVWDAQFESVLFFCQI